MKPELSVWRWIFWNRRRLDSMILSMSDVTQILEAVRQGDLKAADELLPLVYGELRKLAAAKMANEAAGHTLQPTALVHEVDKLRPPYNVSVLNAECALFALEHQEIFAAQAIELRKQRAIILEALGKLPGARAYPSEANMILVRVSDAEKTFEGMKARKVLVKNVSAMHPLLANCLRLTVGTADENQQMLGALRECL